MGASEIELPSAAGRAVRLNAADIVAYKAGRAARLAAVDAMAQADADLGIEYR